MAHQHHDQRGDPGGSLHELLQAARSRTRGRFGPFGDPELRRALEGGFGLGGRGMHRGRVPRGNLRAAVLLLLEQRRRNGYQLIQEIGERSRGVWEPSPGSVYPALQLLEDEGLIQAEEAEGQRLFALTDKGRAEVEAHRADWGSPWDDVSGAVGDDVHELVSLLRRTAGALFQVARTGTPEQVAKASRLIKETKRGLYAILAEEEGEEQAEGGGKEVG